MYKLITELSQMGNFFSDLRASTAVAIDTETTGLDCHVNQLTTVQLKLNNTIYIIDARKFGKKNLTYIMELLAGSNTLLLAHNAKFDWKFLYKNTGVKLMNMYCTMLGEVMITMGIGDTYYSYKELVQKYCGVELSKEERNEFIDNPDIVLTENVLMYSALDVNYLEDIYTYQCVELASRGLLKSCFEVEMPAISATAEMEFNGIKLVPEVWSELEERARAKAEETSIKVFAQLLDDITTKLKYKNLLQLCELLGTTADLKTKKAQAVAVQITNKEQIQEYLREHLNLNSHVQLLNVLVKVYEIPIKDTNEKTINKYIEDFPIISDILVYKGYIKGATSFGSGYIDKIHPVTKRIHTEFNQMGTATSRYSSEKPNMQNVKGEEEYRSGFVPEEGWSFICADYSQQELRMIAQVSKDKAMIRMFNEDIDPHTFTAAGLFDKEVVDVTKDERSRGKSVNFGISYGITPWGLYKNYGIPTEEGEVYLEKYWQIYSGFKAFKDKAEEKIWELKYSRTLLGRKRYFTNKLVFTGSNPTRERDKWKAKLLREGINLIIQGSCAEMTKIALRNLQVNNPFGEKFKLILTVHDEILCECLDEIKEQANTFVKETMLNAERKFITIVPSKVDCKVAKCWVH